MEEHLLRLEGKIDKIQKRIASVDVTLAAQAEQLAGHIRRTEIAEERLDHHDVELAPLQKHVHHVEGGLKLLGLISVLAGIAGTVAALLSYL